MTLEDVFNSIASFFREIIVFMWTVELYLLSLIIITIVFFFGMNNYDNQPWWVTVIFTVLCLFSAYWTVILLPDKYSLI